MSRSSFKVQLYPHQVAAIRFKGSIDDMLVARAVDECLNRDSTWLMIDFSETIHANSTAISRLLQQKDVVQNKGGRIAFVEPTGNVGIVFDMMGLREVFTVYANLEDGLRDLIAQSSGTRKINF